MHTRPLLKINLIKVVLCTVFLFIGSVLVGSKPASATNVSGVVSGTWTAANSPYVVTGSLYVAPSTTLTIDAGVTVKFPSNVVMQVDGSVDANGTITDPIYFTSNAGSPAAGDWYGVQFFSGSTGDFTYTTFSYGGKHCTGSCSLSDKMISNEGGTLTFEDSSLLNSFHYAIHQTAGTATFEGGLIDNNTDGIYFNSGSMSFDDVEIKDLIDARSTATSLTVTDSYLNTGKIYTDAPIFTFTGNDLDAAEVKIKTLKKFVHSGNDAGSGAAGYYLTGNTGSDSELTAEDGMAYIIDNFGIQSGHSVIVEAGSVFKFAATTGNLLQVLGALEVKGTEEDPVYFTSIKDDAAGGDTNDDSTATSPAAGDWIGIDFVAGSVGNFTNTIIRYGGKVCGGCTINSKMLWNEGANLTFTDSDLLSSLHHAIYQNTGTNGTVAFSGGTIDDNADGVYYDKGAMTFMDGALVKDKIDARSTAKSLTFVDSDLTNGQIDSYVPFTFTGNEISNSTVNIKIFSTFIHSGNTVTSGVPGYYINASTSGDAVLGPESGMAYITEGFSVNYGDTLTFQPGAIVKFNNPNSFVYVYGGGTLNLNGLDANPVYFTSYKDDSIGGDTNNNGASSGAAGDWGMLDFASGSTVNISNALIRYGGYNSSAPSRHMILNEGGTVRITNSDISDSYLYGYYQTTGTTLMQAGSLSGHSRGAYIVSGTVDFVGVSIVYNSQMGVFATGGTITLSGSTIDGNSSYGVYSSSPTINAEGNFWGDASGPYESTYNPTGTGDTVTSNVDFNPWETALETNLPSVAITSHANNDEVLSATIDVTGTVSDADSGVASVSVNGIDCEIDSGDWSCDDVPVKPYSNTVEAVATDNDGNVATTSLTIKRRVPVIIIPGLLGSHLIDNDLSETTWFDPLRFVVDYPNILHIFDILTMSMEDQFIVDSLAMNSSGVSLHDVVPGDILRDVLDAHPSFTPAISIYGGLIDQMINSGYVEDSSLFPFAYDWRLSLTDLDGDLADKIDDVITSTGSDHVDLVTHSMGGLLAKQYLRDYGNEKVRKIVNVGSPNLGSANSIDALVNGTDFGYNSLVLGWLDDLHVDEDFQENYPLIAGAYEYFLSYLQSYEETFPVNTEKIKELVLNMPSVYELLPSPTYLNKVVKYIEVLGPPSYSASYNQSMAYMENEQSLNATLLTAAQEYHDERLEYTDFGAIDAYNIIACNSATPAAYAFDSMTGDTLLTGWAGGDTVIPYQSSDFLATPKSKKFYLSDNTLVHDNLTSVTDLREAIVEILTESGDAERADLENDTSNCGLTGDSLTWESPVDIHIYDSEGHHTGPNDRGGIDRQIPGIGYLIMGHYKFVFLPNTNEKYNIVSIGTDAGSYDLTVEKYVKDRVTHSLVYNDIPVRVGTRSVLKKDNGTLEESMMVDDSSNKSKIYTPTSELDDLQSKDYSGPSVKAMQSAGSKILLVAADDLSGVANIYYSLNGADFQVYSSPLNVDLGQMTKITFFAVDRAGNNGSIQQYQYDPVAAQEIKN